MTTKEKERALQWLAFHRRHPIVFRTYCRLLITEIKAGRQNFGIAAVTERMRWDPMVLKRIGKASLNDHFDPYWSRLFAATYPHHRGALEYRASGADEINYNAILLGDDEKAIGHDEQFEFNFEEGAA